MGINWGIGLRTCFWCAIGLLFSCSNDAVRIADDAAMDAGSFMTGDPCAEVECSPFARCSVSASGEATCTCAAGFESSNGGKTCDDIDECLQDNGGCDPRTICTNTEGGRDCGVCPPGYEGRGETGCIEVSEEAECTNLQACEASGTCDQNIVICSMSGGTRSCECAAGHQAIDGGACCVDIDECATGVAGCDSIATCTNTIGGFTCECPEGYVSEDGGKTCECPGTNVVEFTPQSSWSWTPPAKCSNVFVQMWGGGGGGVASGGAGGGGGYAEGHVPVIGRRALAIFVGAGGAYGNIGVSEGPGGWSPEGGGAGGGSSIVANIFGDALIAGGGGGAGRSSDSANGGAGGGEVGQDAHRGFAIRNPAGGGGQRSGGAAEPARVSHSGRRGRGGDAEGNGGGGGSGYYGGGGGFVGGGGGGSGYLDRSVKGGKLLGGDGRMPPETNNPRYKRNVGVGGHRSAGGDGLVVVVW